MNDYQYRTSEYCRKPFVLRKSHIDEDIFRAVLIEEEYGYLRFAEEPNVIVDAGANIGTASVYFANKYPKAKIYAIEPAEDNYEILCLNAKAYDNIIPVHAALMGEEGTGYVQDVGSVLGYRVHLGMGGEVTCHSIVSFCKEFGISHIDLLKIDIEGAEKDVFQHTDRWLPMVDAIAVELHERYVKGCNKTVFDALEREFPWEWIGGENYFFVREKCAFPVVPCGFKTEKPQKLLSEVLNSVQEEKDQELKKRDAVIEELVCVRDSKDQELKKRDAVIEELICARDGKNRGLKSKIKFW